MYLAFVRTKFHVHEHKINNKFREQITPQIQDFTVVHNDHDNRQPLPHKNGSIFYLFDSRSLLD